MAVTAAQLLDELMGRDRDRPASERRAQSKWDDPDVCKYNLCGFCPHDLFVNTRADLGMCEKLHDDHLQAEYQKSGRFERMGYEEDMVRFLQTLIAEVERRIRRGHQRLLINSKQGSLNVSTAQSTEERAQILTEKINDLVAQAEELGCEGKVEEAQGMMKLCDQLIVERQQLEGVASGDIQTGTAEFEKTMEVCDVCGALLVVGDAQQRIDEHLMGKQHMGYARIRAYVEGKKIERQEKQQAIDNEVESRLAKEREEREQEREKEREERRKREEEREKERKKEREQQRRSCSKDRDRHRDRSRDRKRSSSRDRKRRKRSRSRENRRSRSREHNSKSGSHRGRRSHSRERRSDSKHSQRSRHKSRSRSKGRRSDERRSDDKRPDEKYSGKRRSNEKHSGERQSSIKRDDDRRKDDRLDDDRREDDRREDDKREDGRREDDRRDDDRRDDDRREDDKRDDDKQEDHRRDDDKREDHRREDDKREDHRREDDKRDDDKRDDDRRDDNRRNSKENEPVNGNTMMEHTEENDTQPDTNSIEKQSSLDTEGINKDE